jgi:hypothetical protein
VQLDKAECKPLDAKTFIAEMTKALAWPLALVVVGLLFRSNVSGLLEGVKLRRISKGEWLADFQAVAQEVRAEIPEPAQRVDRVPGLLDTETERLIELAPAAAVMQTWNRLEGFVAAIAGKAGIAQKLLPDLLRALVEKGLIRPSTRDSILGLRNMRNLAVHAPGERLTPKQAREFVMLAEATMWSLEQNPKRQ